MRRSDQLVEAIKAQARGWHIFPCEPGDKRGMFLNNGAGWRIPWYEWATNDIDLIMKWWCNHPDLNIGISCKKSNLLVVDCDMSKELSIYDHGVDQFYRLTCARTADWFWDSMIDTYTVETPSAGVHFYYRWPKEVQASQRSLDSLLDVRTNGGEKGGYVVGASSVVDGKQYLAKDPATPVRECPGWLLDAVRVKEPSKRIDEPFTKPYAVFDKYRGLRDSVGSAPEGNRNDTLNWAAKKMAEDGVEEEEILTQLLEVALEAGLTEGETRRTVHSAWRAGNRGTP